MAADGCFGAHKNESPNISREAVAYWGARFVNRALTEEVAHPLHQ